MVKHRMEKPHVGLLEPVQKERACTALQCGPPESACLRDFPGKVLSHLWWPISLFLVVSSLLLSTADLLPGGLGERGLADGESPVNTVDCASLTRAPIDDFSIKGRTRTKSTQTKTRVSPAPSRLLHGPGHPTCNGSLHTDF